MSGKKTIKKDAALEKLLSQQVAEIRLIAGEQVPIKQLAGILRRTISMVDDARDNGLNGFENEIAGMKQFIEKAHREISVVRPKTMRLVDIPDAADELDAVVKATEAAANSILDSAEKLESMRGSLSGRDAETLESAVTQIFEASNFQDITGQRISKVINTLQGIETRIARLTALFPDVIEAAGERKDGDAELLNGPQLPGLASSQDDVDALFDAI